MFSGARLVPQGAKSPRHSTRCCLGPCAHRHQLGGESFVSSLPSGAAVPPSLCTRLRCFHSLCRLPYHLIPSVCHLIPFPSPLPCKATHPQLSSSSHFPPTREAPLFCPNRSPAFQPHLSNVAMPGVASSKQAGTTQALEHPNFYAHPNLSPVSMLAPPKEMFHYLPPSLYHSGFFLLGKGVTVTVVTGRPPRYRKRGLGSRRTGPVLE